MQIEQGWITAVEQHVQFGAALVFIGWLLKNHALFLEAKRRLNTLWFGHCARTEEPYTPLGNGQQAVTPPPHAGKF